MKDRNVQFPNRFEFVPVPGTTNIFDVIPAPGTVYEDGTFWNKQNVLQDAVAALYGKDPTATPNDIFAAIRPMIAGAVDAINAKIIVGSYIGNGTYGAGSPCSLTFPSVPKLVGLVVMVTSNAEVISIGDTQNPFMSPGDLSTSFRDGNGFGQASGTYKRYGKRSEDGKTIYWYSNTSAGYQLNNVGSKYIYFAIM